MPNIHQWHITDMELTKISQANFLGNKTIVFLFETENGESVFILHKTLKKLLAQIDSGNRVLLPEPWIFEAFNNRYKVISISDVSRLLVYLSKNNSVVAEFVISRFAEFLSSGAVNRSLHGGQMTTNWTVAFNRH